MDITVTEIMELADMQADSDFTADTPADQLPRNLLERKIQEIFSHIAELEVQAWQCGAGAGCCAQAARIEALEAQLEAVGAGGVSALVRRAAAGALTNEGTIAAQSQHEHWATPTTVLQRTGDALQLLCAGQRPPDAIITGWLDNSSEELQAFCCQYGPSWCQGIAVIDAAMLMVDQPTEIVTPESSADHEHRAAPVEAVGEMRASESLGVAPYADIWGWLQPGTKLYSATQVQAMLSHGIAPGWQAVLEDAARYRWLRINAIGAFRTNDGNGPVSVYHLSKIPAIPGIPEETDAAIDAAIAAQKENHD